MDDTFSLYDAEDDYDPAMDFGDDELDDELDDAPVSHVPVAPSSPAPATVAPAPVAPSTPAPARATWRAGRVTVADLATLPPVPPPTSRGAGAGAHKPAATRRQDPADDERAGTRLARSAPISEVLPLLGWSCVGESGDGGSLWCRPDHSGQSAHDAVVYPATDDEPEKVTVFGAHAQASWGLQGQDHSWSTWDLIGNVFCAGDWRLAARIAAGYPTPADLVDLLTAYPTPPDLAAAVTPANSVDEMLAGPTTVAAAIARMDGTRVDLGDGLVVYLGGERHGIYATVLQGRGDQAFEVEKQITNWVVYRSVRRLLVTIGPDDRPDAFEKRYELRLVRADGQVFPTEQMDFGVKDSTSIETIHLLDAGVKLPVKADDRRQVENVMSNLGFDAIHDEYVWTSTGWALVPDERGIERVVFLAPNGSMTATGVDDSFTIGPPPRSEDGSLKGSQEALGWNDTVDDPATTAAAVRSFVATAPRRPEIPVAILGAIFAAPLRMKNRAVVGLNGAPGSNKSILSAAAYSFYSAHPVSKEALPFNISNGSSVPGAKGQLAWHRDIVLFADDYKKGNRGEDGARWDAIMRVLVQTAYDGQSGDMGTQGGGLRANKPSTATLVFSGELILPEASILQRCVSLQISPGDIDTEGEQNAYDIFRKSHGDTGVARSFCGSYLRFLAGEIGAHDDGLRWLSRAANNDFDECFQHYLTKQRAPGGADRHADAEIRRAAETAAVVAVGWRWLRRFAERGGFAGALPSEQDVEEAMLKVLSANTAEQSVSDYGIRVLSTASEMLTANNGHLLMHDGTRPVLDGGSPGWLMSQTPTGEVRWDPKGVLLGYVSMDHRYVLIVNDALRAIQRAANLEGLETSQLKRGLAKHVVAGTVPGERTPVNMFNRRRGFVFDLERLDLAPMHTPGRQEPEPDPDPEDF